MEKRILRVGSCIQSIRVFIEPSPALSKVVKVATSNKGRLAGELQMILGLKKKFCDLESQ